MQGLSPNTLYSNITDIFKNDTHFHVFIKVTYQNILCNYLKMSVSTYIYPHFYLKSNDLTDTFGAQFFNTVHCFGLTRPRCVGATERISRLRMWGCVRVYAPGLGRTPQKDPLHLVAHELHPPGTRHLLQPAREGLQELSARKACSVQAE